MTCIFTLDITLPSDRLLTGSARLLSPDDAVLLSQLEARGKADNARAAAKNNPSRHPTRVGGDTPFGTYAPARLLRQPSYTKAYGRFKLPLVGVSGDALAAMQNGRMHLLVHGGHTTKSGALMATYGCIRMFDDDLAAIAAIVKDALITTKISEASATPRAAPLMASLLTDLKSLVQKYERIA